MLDLYKKEYLNGNKSEYFYYDFYKRYSFYKTNLKRFDYEIDEIKPVYNIRDGFNIANVYYMKKKPIFMAIGPTMESADGEFKKNVLSYDFVKNFAKGNPSCIAFKKEFYEEYHKIIKTSIKKNVLLNVVIACVFFGKIELKHGLYSEDNIKQTKYLKIFTKSITQYEPLFKVLQTPGSEKSFFNSVGTKISPLYFNNVKNFAETNQNHFKEIIIYEILEKYILSGICPFFPIIWDYFILDINTVEIFSNDITYKKYMDSEKYIKYIKHLYKANEIPRDNLVVIETLKDLISVPIEYAEKKILLSNKCMVLFTEYLGSTFGWFLTKKTPHRTISEYYVPVYKKINIFSAICMNVFYTLHILHTRCKIIHGDLHLNNLTIIFYTMVVDIIYKIDGVEYPANSPGNVFLIDFGRSIYHQSFLIQRGDVESCGDNNKLLASYCKKVLPEFYEQRKKYINDLINRNFDLAFRILCVCDYIYFLQCFKFSHSEKADPSIIELCNVFISYATNFIKEGIIKEECEDFGPKIFDYGFMSVGDEKVAYTSYFDADKKEPKEFNEFINQVLGEDGKEFLRKKKIKNYSGVRKDFEKYYENFLNK